MLNFEYKGISYGKYVEGEIEALNNSEAAHKLKEQKVIITKLVQSKKILIFLKTNLNFFLVYLPILTHFDVVYDTVY